MAVPWSSVCTTLSQGTNTVTSVDHDLQG